MREILFRGKRTDNGKWVEGYFWRGVDHIYMIPSHVGIGYDDKTKYMSAYAVEVGPETLCQYTGLTDKNGKKVFIGDIIRCTKGCPHEVIWLKEYAGVYLGGMPAVYLSGLREGYAWTGEEEKIGNIFDDPELLKGE